MLVLNIMTYWVMGEPLLEGAVHSIEILVCVVLTLVGATGVAGTVAKMTPRTLLRGPSPAALTALT